MLTAIIVAAGSSRRMGFDKLLAPLAGTSVLEQTTLRFLSTPEIHELILVCPEERFKSLSAELTTHKKVKRVDGGAERHHSVLAGLNAAHADCTYIAIHDGARPLITPEAIQECYKVAQHTGAATLARPVTETIKRASPERRVTDSVSRENLWFMETPQIFSTPLIKKAYEEVEQQGKLVTDEVSALQLIGQDTHLVTSPCINPKITYPSDLTIAEKFLS